MDTDEAAVASEPRLRAASLLGGAIASTVALMRRNAKWAPGYGGAGGAEDPLLQGFRTLRRQLYAWRDWAAVAPLEYLAPFLAVVRSDETSGPITGAALQALYAILTADLVQPDAPGAADAMHALVDAVTHCRFEATDPGHDEAVLASICDVLLAALRCAAGRLLSDDAVCAVVQAAYHIGHQSGREGALLTGVSRRTLRDAVRHVFAQAPARAADAAYIAALSAAAHAPRLSTASPGGSAPPPSPRAAPPGTLPYGLPCCVEVAAFAASLASFEDDAAPSLRDDLRLTGVQLAAAALDAGAEAFARYPPLLLLAREDLPRALVTAAAAPGAPPPLLSAACALMVSLYLRLRPLMKHQLAAFLQFVLLPLGDGAGGGNASANGNGNGSSGNLAGGGGGGGGSALSEAARSDAARVALEALADLCRQPSFGADLFANFDCDMRWPPLFEHTAALLSKAAFPGAAPLAGVNLVALEGVLALLDAMAERAAGVEEAAAAAAGGGGGAGEAAVDRDPEVYDPRVWAAPGAHLDAAAAALAAGDVAAAAAALRRARYLKQRVAAGAAHFNRDDAKGLAFLRAARLLPEQIAAAASVNAPPDPAAVSAVAAFLRYAAPLDKAAVGEYLGEMNPFVVAVLQAYAALFDFAGLPLDRALRLFLDGFLLPGEAQKIHRCLEAFAARFYACNSGPGAGASGCVAADADAAFVLCYSIIMLNTDLHNPQVRNKMTLQQFIKNNRGTNAGADWTPQYLTDMYESIAADEIKISAAGAPGGATSASWLAAARAAAAGEGGLLCAPPALAAGLDGDLFALMWGPAVGALACVFEAGDASAAARGALADAAAGFRAVARVAAAHGMGDVADHVVATLVRFTAPHTGFAPPPGSGAAAACGVPAVAFGADSRARLAALTACGIAAKHGDALRAGWGAVLDLLLRMHRMDVITLPSFDDSAEGGASQLSARGSRGALAAPPPPTPSGVGLLRLGFSSLLSLDAEPAAPPALTAAEAEAAARAQRCGERCRVDELLADTKFLETASLQALVRAAAAAGVAAADDADAACACLDLLGAVTLRNRDRLTAVWPDVAAHLRGCVTGAGGPTPAAERALVTLLRLCQRLLPYKEELADELLGALRMTLQLDAKTADALMPRLAAEVRTLLQAAGAHVGQAAGWDTVCRLLTAAARHAEASAAAFDALCSVMRADALPPPAFGPCAAAAAAFAASRAGGEERSRAALGLLCAAGESLALRPAGEEALAHWADVVALLRRCAADERPDVRDDALAALPRVLLAAEPLSPPAQLLAQLYDSALLPLFSELVDAARRRGRDAAAAERALRHAIPALCKPLLQYLPALTAQLPPSDWAALWGAVLDRLATAQRVAASEELAEAVPEALKNCVLVMATAGALTPQDAPFWELTWKRCAAVDEGLTPALLQLARPSAPQLQPAAAVPEPEPVQAVAEEAQPAEEPAAEQPQAAAEEDLT